MLSQITKANNDREKEGSLLLEDSDGDLSSMELATPLNLTSVLPISHSDGESPTVDPPSDMPSSPLPLSRTQSLSPQSSPPHPLPRKGSVNLIDVGNELAAEQRRLESRESEVKELLHVAEDLRHRLGSIDAADAES
jgi:hypothetical protein